MADATARIIHKTRPSSGVGAYVVANGVSVYAGMLCQLESGYLNHWDETGTFLGIVTGEGIGVDPSVADDPGTAATVTGNTSASIPPEARVDESGIILERLASVGGTPTQAKVGDLVYCADSDTANLTLTDTTNPPVGRMVRFRSATDVDVQLFTPGQFVAGIADATWNS